MGARDVKGLIRWGGGKSSVLIRVEGKLKGECSLEDLRVEIEKLLRDCGLKVRSIQILKRELKKKKKKK
jgi:hypothetical protein